MHRKSSSLPLTQIKILSSLAPTLQILQVFIKVSQMFPGWSKCVIGPFESFTYSNCLPHPVNYRWITVHFFDSNVVCGEFKKKVLYNTIYWMQYLRKCIALNGQYLRHPSEKCVVKSRWVRLIWHASTDHTDRRQRERGRNLGNVVFGRFNCSPGRSGFKHLVDRPVTCTHNQSHIYKSHTSCRRHGPKQQQTHTWGEKGWGHVSKGVNWTWLINTGHNRWQWGM